MIRNGVPKFVQTDISSLPSTDSYESDLQSRNGFRESLVPIQMVLISYEAGSGTPYRISFFSPSNYSYMELDKDAYSFVISSSELHTHNTYELALVRDGTLSQRIESERHIYPKGSCFLLNRNVRHNEEYDSSFCTVTLSISEKFLKDTLITEFSEDHDAGEYWKEGKDLGQFFDAELNSLDYGRKSYIDFIPTDKESQVAGIFDEMADTMLDPGPGHTFLLKNQLCRLLHQLTKKDFYSTIPVELGTATEGRIFSEIARIVEEGNGRISRTDLSRQMHYSGNYINRLTKKFTGMNLTDYSNAVAMRTAASMLTNTDLTVSEIIEKLSFTNRRYFYREFEKAYGTTPKKYRKDV